MFGHFTTLCIKGLKEKLFSDTFFLDPNLKYWSMFSPFFICQIWLTRTFRNLVCDGLVSWDGPLKFENHYQNLSFESKNKHYHSNEGKFPLKLTTWIKELVVWNSQLWLVDFKQLFNLKKKDSKSSTFFVPSAHKN